MDQKEAQKSRMPTLQRSLYGNATMYNNDGQTIMFRCDEYVSLRLAFPPR
jgi:hypothetical protein